MQDPIFKGNKVPNPETGYPGEFSPPGPLYPTSAQRCHQYFGLAQYVLKSVV